MRGSNSRRMFVVALTALFAVACMCPTSLPFANQAERLKETAGAVSSQVPKGALETVQALATQIPPGTIQTMEAVATQADVSPDTVFATVQSGLEELPGLGLVLTPGAPENIPLLPGEQEGLKQTAGFVEYQSKTSLADAVKFYREQMAAQGWQIQDDKTKESDTATVLYCDRPDRNAIVTLTRLGENTLVAIVITQK